MHAFYSFAGTIEGLALDIVPALTRKLEDPSETVNEDKDRNDHDMPPEWYEFINK